MRLSRLFVILMVITLTAGLSQAQVYLGVQGGVGFSSFEDQDEGATAIPLAVTVGTDLLPILDLGVEANFLVSPYKFNSLDPTDMSTTEIKINQNFYGAYVRWHILPLPVISPYLRGGVAFYDGKWSVGDTDLDLKGTVGFNIGAGVGFLFGLTGEVVYHIVSHELDIENLPSELSGSMGYNTIQVVVGYNFDLLF